jgi:hypothetical protein
LADRRRPNPWIMVPSIVAGVLAGVIGWLVTDVSCRAEVDGVIQHCPGWSAAIATVSFLGVTIGMMVVLVLVYRSLAEYREASAKGQEPPGPGCEVPD